MPRPKNVGFCKGYEVTRWEEIAVQANFLGTLQRSKFAFAPKTLSFTAFYFVKAGFDGASMHRAS